MARVSPLGNLHRAAEAATIPCPAPGGAPIELVASFGQWELEYAAIRRGCALFDQPQRATLVATGADAPDFLNRMLTQAIADLAPWRARRSFWLNRQGRIDADLRVLRLPDRFILDVDAHAAGRTKETLESYIIGEDVVIADETARRHRLALHGPRAAGLLGACAEGGAEAIQSLEDGQVGRCVIGACEVLVDRQDALAAPGYELHMATDDAQRVWERLCEVGLPGEDDKPTPHRLRPAGWHAFNTARVEAGWPLYCVDFGPNSLPHESGVVHDRISFRKGCFLGQEVVARMESRGAGKQILVAIKLATPPRDGASGPVQPITGEAVLDASDPTGAPIGAVTSSVLSPMLGDAPICLAQVKRARSAGGTLVLVEAQGSRMPGEVRATLSFLKEAPVA